MACTCGRFCKCAWNQDWVVCALPEPEQSVILTDDGTEVASAEYTNLWVLEYVATLHNAFRSKNPTDSLEDEIGLITLTSRNTTAFTAVAQIPTGEQIAPSLRVLLEDIIPAPPEAVPLAPRLSPVVSHEMKWEFEPGRDNSCTVRCSCGAIWHHVSVRGYDNKAFLESATHFELQHKAEVLLGLMNVYFSSNAATVRLPELNDVPF